jgi:hypothetical protein
MKRVRISARRLPAIQRRVQRASARLGQTPWEENDAARLALVQRDLDRAIRLSTPPRDAIQQRHEKARRMLHMVEIGLYQGGVAATPKAVRAFLKAHGLTMPSRNHLTDLLDNLRRRATMLTMIADDGVPFTLDALRAAFVARKLSPPPDQFIREFLADNAHWKGYRGE